MADRDRQSAGRKGGESISRDREHMAQIGRKGGESVSRNREHMAQIGRKGGMASGATRSEANEDEDEGRQETLSNGARSRGDGQGRRAAASSRGRTS